MKVKIPNEEQLAGCFPAKGGHVFVLDCMLTHMITQAAISVYLGEIEVMIKFC